MGLPGARRRQSSLVKPEGPASWPRPQYQPLPDPEMISIDAGTPNRQRRWLKFVAVAVVASFAVAFLWHKSPTQQSVLWLRGAQDDRLGVGRPAGDTVPCVGPSGLNYQEDATFSLDEATLPEPNPKPWSGSYGDLNLPQTWITPTARYRPYDTARDDIDWNKTNWGSLQAQCIEKNRARFDPVSQPASNFVRRLKKPEPGEVDAPVPDPRPKTTKGRTALVIRTWDTFNYTDNDRLYLRSLISETSLAYGGEYSVFLLVDVKRDDEDIWGSDADYQNALRDTVPEEFREMAILFNEELMKAWYPYVKEYRPVLQIYQPLQIFAHFFPEYEHFWQLEMDLRFSGHAGHLLKAAGSFSRNEPRKQAFQRTSFFCTPSSYPKYGDLIHNMDAALNGDDDMFTGMRVPEIEKPIGLQIAPPPTLNPREDNFTWGVGEDADVILLDVSLNVTLGLGFIFKPFVFNFSMGLDTPRLHSPPAMGRQSWHLLNAVHDAQRLKGLALPGESTMPSFAMYHALKVSFPPMPLYGANSHHFGKGEYPTIDFWANGGPPRIENWGTGRGQAIYGPEFLPKRPGKQKPTPFMGTTYRFNAHYPQQLWDAWMHGDPRSYDIVTGKAPSLKVWNDQVWIPNLMMHPVKTNKKRPEDLSWIFKEGGIPTFEESSQYPDGVTPGMRVDGSNIRTENLGKVEELATTYHRGNNHNDGSPPDVVANIPDAQP